MADDSWVGFSRSPKPDRNLVRASFEVTLVSWMPIVEQFAFASTAAGLSAWLGPVIKANLKVAGKLEFLGEFFGLAVFTHVELGKRVVINSERWGEVSMTFKEKRARNELELSFTKMVSPEAKSRFLDDVEQVTSVLEFHLGADRE